jgi:hypothetical protein
MVIRNLIERTMMMETKNTRIKQMLKNFLMIFVAGLLIVVALAGLFININIENEKNIIKIRQQNSGEIVSVNVNLIFEDINSDGNIILHSGEMKDYINNTADVNNQGELKRMLSNMMTNKKIYDSIRFVGIDGAEKVRVNDTENGPTAVADSALENKDDQTYFL